MSPFVVGTTTKKNRVYRRLVSIINTRVRKGFGVAVPKQVFDEYVFEEFRQFAENHFVFAVRTLMGFINNWRVDFSLAEPMQYVFESGSPGEEQLRQIWKDCMLHKHSKERYGMVPDGVMFQNKRLIKPLQAADILAWQMQNNMRRTVMIGRDPLDRSLAHPGFLMLRDNRPMELVFYGREHMKKAFENTRAYHDRTGVWPWEPDSGAFLRVMRTEAGAI